MLFDYFRFFILFQFYQFSHAQVRLSSTRTRAFTFTTTTTKPSSSASKSQHDKPSVILQARIGQFFVYSFSHNDFQKSAVENKTGQEKVGVGMARNVDHGSSKYDYTASLNGKPDLPTWLKLATMPFDQVLNRAFLYGTPENNEMEDILILARNLATNEVLMKLIRIQIEDDKRYSSPAKQISELWIENYDIWELLSSSTSTSWSSDLSNIRNTSTDHPEDTLFDKLRLAISKMFRGRAVRPYVLDLESAKQVAGKKHSKYDKTGLVVYVATSHAFPLGLQHLAIGLTKHQDHCNRTEIIPPDAHFSPTFQIDWCQFKISNATRGNGQSSSTLIDGQQFRGADGMRKSSDFAKLSQLETNQMVHHYEPVDTRRDYTWEWVMVAVIPLAILLILVLILSAVFFGCREGQHWRDYKTPRQQLTEYVNLRRTQDRLRMLSNQRQSMDILDATEETRTQMLPNRRQNAPKSPTLSLGKQTVAQAAAVRGSNIDLYKDTDSYDEHDQLLAGSSILRNQRQRRESTGQHDPTRRTSYYDDEKMLIARDSSV